MKFVNLTDFVEAVRAVAEPTRLRILDVLADGELTVSELCRVLAMSQPRISRHLRIMTEAGVLARQVEGSWVFYRSAPHGEDRNLAADILAHYPATDLQRLRDRARLRTVRQQNNRRAKAYFRKVARDWDRVRGLYVSEDQIEQAALEVSGTRDVRCLVDLGTGTGRMLELFAAQTVDAVGVDASREMLSIARARLHQAGLGHYRLLQEDLTGTSLADGCADVVTLHHVLHFLDEPELAVREGARLLAAGGALIIVDFAPHELETLRSEHSHRRLGYHDSEIQRWIEQAGLTGFAAKHLAADDDDDGGAQVLTAVVWHARRKGRRNVRREAA
ncbi:MAG: metalloregulator ArsR/SmtB family transcription factor [Arenicellales bacterium]|nr:metalloregulator ArsR/SmtB family transcription factor [Arenicellales bacterium]